MSASTGHNERVKGPSLLACLNCRRKHLKCDGREPTCQRCESRGSDCKWVESRRGYRGSNQGGLLDVDGSSLLRVHGIDLPLALNSASPSVSTASMHRNDFEEYPNSSVDDDGLIDLFYKYFWPAHPFIVPRLLLKREPFIVPNHLTKIMCFVGSHYMRGYDRDYLRVAIIAELSGDLSDDVFTVQALLLFGMISFARYEESQGCEMVDRAVTLALKLNMNRKTCTKFNLDGSPVLLESFFRTWWELYVVNGLMSMVSGSKLPFRLQHIASDVPLPGPDHAYSKGLVQPVSRTLDEMMDRAFVDDGFEWSSSAYKVEAMRIMSAVMALGNDHFTTEEDAVESIDASISGFLHSLPPTKRQVVEENGTVDEVLFGAHMIIHWAAIALHRPRSSLPYIRNHYRTACTKNEMVGLPALEYASHDAKALRASNAISSLAAIQSPLARHTPCFPCALTLAATVQLPSSVLANSPGDMAGLKERLRLSVNALGVIGEVFPMARVVKTQVAHYAKEVFSNTALFDGTLIQEPPKPLAAQALLQDVPDANLDDDAWLQELLNPNTFSAGVESLTSLQSVTT